MQCPVDAKYAHTEEHHPEGEHDKDDLMHPHALLTFLPAGFAALCLALSA